MNDRESRLGNSATSVTLTGPTMSDRAFTAQRYNVVDGPAEPGYDWGVNNHCKQVRLELFDNGRFRLTLSTYYSDWGDVRDDQVIYEGTYEEQDRGIICHATSRSEDLYFTDHEMGTKDKSKRTQEVDDRFDFGKRSSDELVCPVDHGDLAGVVMSTQVTPQKSLRKR